MIPLLKDRNKDLSDVNNYRAIALSNSVTKIFENILYEHIATVDEADIYQFGFKKDHSTATCTYALKQVVDYYRRNGSHVFASFIDFSKAFDSVDYWLLFSELLDSKPTAECFMATRVLAFWYSSQSSVIRWQSVVSGSFSISNGVRQGGILSPFLFRFYIRKLIHKITRSGIGCYFMNRFVNLLAYADDIVLLAPSWYTMQNLLHILERASKEISMVCNTQKTLCMVFNPHIKSKLVCENFPNFVLDGHQLSFVPTFKYLGHIIEKNMCDDLDIAREIRNLYFRTNVLKRRFGLCSLEVKLKLFKSFCICFYDIALWLNYSKTIFGRMKSCYTKCVKSFFNFHKYSSVTEVFMYLGLPLFDTIIHNSRLSLFNRVLRSSNSLVSSIGGSV